MIFFSPVITDRRLLLHNTFAFLSIRDRLIAGYNNNVQYVDSPQLQSYHTKQTVYRHYKENQKLLKLKTYTM